MARNTKRKKKAPRVWVVVTAEVAGRRHMVSLDMPRGTWELDELHEMARTVAEAAGFIGLGTGAVSVGVSYGLGRF